MPQQKRTEYTSKYSMKKSPGSLGCEVFGGSLPESVKKLSSGKSLSSENSQLNFKISSSSSDSDEVNIRVNKLV